MGLLLKKVFMSILFAGLLLALLRVFNYDPFGIFEWIVSWLKWVIDSIANLFLGSPIFHDITRKPA